MNDQNYHNITNCATRDVRDILCETIRRDHVDDDNDDTAPLSTKETQTRRRPLTNHNMNGFECTTTRRKFVDIVDYVIKVTHWIWNDKHTALCHDYYYRRSNDEESEGNTIVHSTIAMIDCDEEEDGDGTRSNDSDLNIQIHGYGKSCKPALIEKNIQDLHTLFPDLGMFTENVVWNLEKSQQQEQQQQQQRSNTNDEDTYPTYYTSQLAVCTMTYRGTLNRPTRSSSFFPFRTTSSSSSSTTPSSLVLAKAFETTKPTHQRARIRTIIDRICYKNKIVTEWILCDTSFLLKSIGINFRRVAIEYAHNEYRLSQQQQRKRKRRQQRQSQGETNSKSHLVDQLQKERDRVMKHNILTPPSRQKLNIHDLSPRPNVNLHAYVIQYMNIIWGQRDRTYNSTNQQQRQRQPQPVSNSSSSIEEIYDSRVVAHMPGGRELYGHVELLEYLDRYLQRGLSNISISVDHVACIPYLLPRAADTTNPMDDDVRSAPMNTTTTSPSVNNHPSVDIAIRWSLVATHSGRHRLLGVPSHRPVYIMASTHLRIIDGYKIREEWTVWDEVSLLRQAELQRLVKQTEDGGDYFSIIVDRIILVLVIVLAVVIKLRLDGFVVTEYFGIS